MPDEAETEEKSGTKGVSLYIPHSLYNTITKIIKREGYNNVSDFFRDAGRRLVQFYDTKYYAEVLQFLMSNGKITSQDVHEAIQQCLLRNQ